jgi:hypothetical protein
MSRLSPQLLHTKYTRYTQDHSILGLGGTRGGVAMKRRILLVEDDMFMREFIKKYIKHCKVSMSLTFTNLYYHSRLRDNKHIPKACYKLVFCLYNI